MPDPAPGTAPAAVPAGNGTAWWSEAWRLFTAAPWVWVGITVLFCIIYVILSILPLLGMVAPTVLSAVFAGGVFLGCREIDRGGELAISHLFAGFSDRMGPLLIVGLLYLAGQCAIFAVVVCVLVASVGMSGIGMLFSGDLMQAGYSALASLGLGALVAALVGVLVAIPLIMAYWFAPALVALRHDEPIAAMKASFQACLVNMLPMLVYSLVGVVFAVIASIPLLLGWLVLGPVFATSVYASYKDIFRA